MSLFHHARAVGLLAQNDVRPSEIETALPALRSMSRTRHGMQSFVAWTWLYPTMQKSYRHNGLGLSRLQVLDPKHQTPTRIDMNPNPATKRYETGMHNAQRTRAVQQALAVQLVSSMSNWQYKQN